VAKIGELGTTQAATSNRRTLRTSVRLRTKGHGICLFVVVAYKPVARKQAVLSAVEVGEIIIYIWTASVIV
jgi:hypothetical protein